MSIISEDNETYESLGIKFGYPMCCIKFFELNADFSEEWIAYARANPFSGTGFIACPHCSQQITVTLSHIQVHRDKSLPAFPNHD